MSKIYTEKELKSIDSEIHDASMKGDTPSWQHAYDKYTNVPVTIEMPLGEMTNPNIKGFLWGAHMKGNISYPFPIDDRDRFRAQGLEGKFRVKSDMMTAILMIREIPKYRYQVKKGHVVGKYD